MKKGVGNAVEMGSMKLSLGKKRRESAAVYFYYTRCCSETTMRLNCTHFEYIGFFMLLVTDMTYVFT